MAIKVGVVGLGFSGRTFHLPFLTTLDRYRVTAVVSRQSDLARSLIPDAQRYDSMDELLASNVELVVITAPNTAHYPLAKAALSAQKHVVLEKPFVTNSTEGHELVQLAQQNNVVLSMYHNRRWDGDFLTVSQLIHDGVLGEVTGYESRFDRFRPDVRDRWRERPLPGSGILFDLGSHLIDQALVLFGEPAAVTAQILCQRKDAQADDYFNIVLDYGRLQVMLHASMLTVRPPYRFCVHGARGIYVKSGMDPQEERLMAGIPPTTAEWARENPECFGTLFAAGGQRETVPTVVGKYASFYEQLADCIDKGGANPVPAQQALKVIQLIELAKLSHDTGQRIALR